MQKQTKFSLCVNCVQINSPVSLSIDTSSFLVSGGCWMGREDGGVVCRKIIMQQRERDTYLKRAMDDINWRLRWAISPGIPPPREEPWKQYENHVTAWEKAGLVNIDPKQSQQKWLMCCHSVALVFIVCAAKALFLTNTFVSQLYTKLYLTWLSQHVHVKPRTEPDLFFLLLANCNCFQKLRFMC